MRTFIPAKCDAACRAERGASLCSAGGFDRLSPNGGGASVPPRNGFTLIELMVVLTIIGFISAAVVIAIPDPRGRIVDDADRFAARVAAARDEAVVTARPMGVWVSASGYGFQRREGGQWVPMEEKPFVSANWKTGTRALVGQDGRQQIAFDGTGLPTDPLTITLAREAERVQVSVDMAGKVAVGG
ncbi:prepilin-type N-terminal cleavage/methylation domain-containing protein [Sphingobium yanoikuyae]|nr:prepilin-type N-terminal cleavage/methylation domain-containing protein [Sphingobium yanoikuyae]